MKIGILTYHRANNYGAMLQAYALRQVLLNYSQDVSFVAYNPQYITDDYATVVHRKSFTSCSKRKKLQYVSYLIHYLHLKYKERKRNRAFEAFAHTQLPEERIDVKYDVLVYGSDQIWCKQHVKTCPGYDTFYFGDNNIEAQRSIAYAASMGSIEAQPEDYDFLKTSLSRYDAISVREKSLTDLLERITKSNIKITLDPTLLLRREQWNEIIPSGRFVKEQYVLCYNILEDREVDRYAVKYAKKHNLRLINLVPRIYDKAYTKDDYITAGPLEFLRLVRDAEFVISSSFHGVAFSIIYQKQFIAKLNHKAERVSSLLEQLGLSKVLVNKMEDEIKPDISYKDLENRLQELRKQSLNYIEESIQ